MDEKDNAVMDKVPAWKDDSVYYLIANLAAYFCICVVCVFVVINLIESVIVRICVLPVLFLLCAYLEERVVVKFVGILLKYTLIKFLEEKIWKRGIQGRRNKDTKLDRSISRTCEERR